MGDVSVNKQANYKQEDDDGEACQPRLSVSIKFAKIIIMLITVRFNFYPCANYCVV